MKRSIPLPPIVIDRFVPGIDVRPLAQHMGDQWRVMSAHYSDFVPLPDEPPGVLAYEFGLVTVEFFRIFDAGYDDRDIAVHVVTDPANLTPTDDHEGFYDPDALRCRNPLLAAVIETERAKWVTKFVAASNPMLLKIMGEVKAEADQQVPSLAKNDVEKATLHTTPPSGQNVFTSLRLSSRPLD